MAKTPAAAPKFVYVKVTLNDIRPPIWRRLRVPVSWHLGKLSDAILRGMGWSGGHLHAFEIGDEQYGDPAMLEGGRDERRMTILKLIAQGVNRFGYTYDFGDNWEHSLLIEAKAPPAEETAPGCVAGKRACPPDDIGGAPGYDDLLVTLATPDTPEAQEMLEWLGGGFAAEAFDLEVADRRVKAI